MWIELGCSFPHPSECASDDLQQHWPVNAKLLMNQKRTKKQPAAKLPQEENCLHQRDKMSI